MADDPGAGARRYGCDASQPSIVGLMTQALEITPKSKVLEIGTGSGYQAAILGEIAAEVYTIEIIPSLGERARRVLADLGYGNVHVRVGDGYAGWPEEAPFDAVVVTVCNEGYSSSIAAATLST